MRFVVLLICVGLAGADSEPADAIQARYREAVSRFRQQTERWQRTGLGDADFGGEKTLRRDIDSLRAAYKRLEFLTEYAYPGSAARLNAPPLERAEARMPDALEVFAPVGLQILGQIADDAPPPSAASRARLKTLSSDLCDAARELEDNVHLDDASLDDRRVFEALQEQVLRVMTKGITGFDPPSTECALPESRLSLEALRPVVGLYLPPLRRRNPVLAARLSAALDRAIAALPSRASKADFDAFDRLDFLRRAGNPLYAALVDAQQALGFATFADLAPLRRPVSTTARNLFAPDFLDAHFYSRTPGDRRDSAVESLGRRLFFDPLLSHDRKRSCASCHDPRKAFSDGLARSPAFSGGSLLRNAPGLSHAAYQSDQFWDMRETTLEKQVQHVIAGGEEFRSDFMVLIGRLRENPDYPAHFKRAFGTADGRSEALQMKTATKALAMYVRSLGRWNAPFDRYARGESSALDSAARRGFNLFMGKAACATCHFPPAFNGTVPPRYSETESEVIGAPERFPPLPGQALRLDPDKGRGMTLHNALFQGAFKTPSLRNVALTPPYMHNGGMATLEEVLDFYNAGGGRGLGLEVPHQTLPSDSLHLSRRERDDIVAFLKSLTDTTGYGAQGTGRPDP